MLQYNCLSGIFNNELEGISTKLECEIIDRAQAEEALMKSDELFRTISNTVKDAVIMIDNEGDISFWNDTAEEMFGYTKIEVLGKELHALLAPPRYHGLFNKRFPHFRKTGEGALIGNTMEFVAIRKNGNEFPVELSLSSINLKGEWHAIGVLRDVSERKQMEAKLRQLAITDPLTNVFDRYHFFTLADKEFERARRYNHSLSVILLDVDRFKHINDTFGHTFSDQVLKALASRCQGNMREIDLFARYGSEEFVVLLPETDRKQAHLVAERLRKEIADLPMEFEGETVSVTISLGVASLVGEKAISLDKLLRQADKAMAIAKRSGRNRVSVWQER